MNMTQQQTAFLEVLQLRFAQNANRHPGIDWSEVEQKLMASPEKLASVFEMETSGGEPDLICFDQQWFYVDCSAESPTGRRSLCYDTKALDQRKEHKPSGSAVEMAHKMGIQLLDENQYRALQTFGKFDLKTSSWVQTSSEIRKLGGALFCDRRYDAVFVYHNGASSYYAARGFRGCIQL
jgi:hypothetical protein